MQPSPFAATQCNRFFGFELQHRGADRVEVALPVRAEFLQEEGVVHGGVLTALADTAAVYLLWPDLPPDRGMTGIECKMNFLGAAMLSAGPLVATATPLRIGRTIAVCETVVQQAGRTVAKGTFTFLLRPRAAAAAP
ncbi:MAG TPA: PaaI family thioesterase [Planctomycetota bacterium]|nr:PaaI family thioesterase [Planctomycetota bacterium]